MTLRLENFYFLHFENRFLKLNREDFQSWFVEIMSCAFPKDFIGTRQGTHKGGGDANCDGFRASTGTVYAVYAPRKCTLAELHRKIEDDFQGGLTHFGELMREWVFVHNEPDGKLSTDTVLLLAKLQKANLGIVIGQHIGKVALWEIVRKIEPRILQSQLGFPEPMTDRTIDRLGMADLQMVLRFIEQRQVPNDVPTDPPNVRKLEHNQLSPHIMDLLRMGRRRGQLVEQYFAGCPDVQRGEGIAQTFRDHYQRMRIAGWDPDKIVSELSGIAGGFDFHPPELQAAVWTVLSYYFERCDIFENPPE